MRKSEIKIVSGGQTGVDRGALQAAMDLGLDWGGWAPIIHGHEHRLTSGRPATTRDSICVCAKWHGWKPITLAEAIRQMDAAQG